MTKKSSIKSNDGDVMVIDTDVGGDYTINDSEPRLSSQHQFNSVSSMSESALVSYTSPNIASPELLNMNKPSTPILPDKLSPLSNIGVATPYSLSTTLSSSSSSNLPLSSSSSTLLSSSSPL